MDVAYPENIPDRDADITLTTLVRQAQAGSAEASQLLFDRCRRPLLAVIRQVIHPRLRQLYDSDDFLGETFLEIFTRYFTDEVLKSPETLWPYLKRIAENKVRDANRKYLHTQRHNINLVKSLDTLAVEDSEQSLWAKELTPEEAYLLNELIHDRLADLIRQLPELMQQIIKLVLQGATAGEIADRLGVESKRIYRAMDWLRKKIRE